MKTDSGPSPVIATDDDGGVSGVTTTFGSADGEFRVNTTTSGDQILEGQYDVSPGRAIAADASGNFVIVWASRYQDGSGYGVYGQRYNASGATAGNEFQVNTHTTGDQLYASVAMDAAGNFVVAWASDGQDGEKDGVYAQRFDALGNRQGSEFQVNTYTSLNQTHPSVATNDAGNFVITWSSHVQDGSKYGVYGQLYDTAGNEVGGESRSTRTRPTNNAYLQWLWTVMATSSSRGRVSVRTVTFTVSLARDLMRRATRLAVNSREYPHIQPAAMAVGRHEPVGRFRRGLVEP